MKGKATDATQQATRYFILYGLLGGPAHGWRLRRLLKARGWELARRAEDADVIMAHSAGAWFLPDKLSARLLIIVGMPLRSGPASRAFLAASRQNTRSFIRDRRLLRGLEITLISTMYMLLQPRRTRRIIRMSARRHAIPLPPLGAARVFAANRYDPWPQPAALPAYIEREPFTFVSLPGPHTGIWENAEDMARFITRVAQGVAK